MSEYLKFQENKKTDPLVLEYDQPNDSVNSFGKKQYTYGIQPLITGENKFSATEKLHEKIHELKVAKGDTIFIEKVKDPEINKGYAFFKVSLPENHIQKKTPTIDKGAANFEKQFEKPDVKMELHELNLRVETLETAMNRLEKVVATLWWNHMHGEEEGKKDKQEAKPEEHLPF